MVSITSDMAVKEVPTTPARALPAGVRPTLRCARVKSGVFSSRSKVLICWLTAAWVTPSSAEARVKLPRRAAASKVASRFSDETLRRSVTMGKPRSERLAVA